jgi:hypothetical protein
MPPPEVASCRRCRGHKSQQPSFAGYAKKKKKKKRKEKKKKKM